MHTTPCGQTPGEVMAAPWTVETSEMLASIPIAAVRSFFVLPITILVLLVGGLGLLSPDPTGATTAEGRCEGEVDVFLRVKADHEGRHVYDLFADPNVALADENAGVVDRFGETELVDQCLEAAFQEILYLEGQHVIQLHSRLVENADANQAADEGIAFEETLGVLLLEGEQLTTPVSLGPGTPG